MANTILVGAQWGDEGKGKIIDVLTEKADIVADLSKKLSGSPFMLVTDYQKMKVGQFSELRNRLAPAGAVQLTATQVIVSPSMTSSPSIT